MAQGGWIWFIGGMALAGLCLAGLCLPGPHVLLANLAGIGCALAGFSGVRGRVIEHFQGLGSLAFGLYLVHIIPTGLMRGQGPHLHLDPSGVAFALVVMAVVTLASLAVAFVLSQLRAGAWLIPGASDGGRESGTKDATAVREARQAEPTADGQALATPADLLLTRLRSARAG
jgi:peptidoglycan/LPS O-acetylase OafA/YrhL